MHYHDLAISWNWEHDADFVDLLEIACRERSLSLLQITPANLATVQASLQCRDAAFGNLLDRASDADLNFLPVAEWADQNGACSINPHQHACRAWDKTTMHREFLSAGLLVPDAIVLPPFHEQVELPLLDLSPLGPSFTIKPASRGGGEGVVNEATSLGEVLAVRQQFPEDRYLLQAHIAPAQCGPRSAWFRVIYCADKVYACWWDVRTHVYEPAHQVEHGEDTFERLLDLTRRIAEICSLGLFSTEIALTQQGDLIVVDYVNDPVDLRLQSKAADGVPDAVVAAIAQHLAQFISHRSA
jgi:glutathione synthase/RimK-type ligase-like ATP-grasp enzyme